LALRLLARIFALDLAEIFICFLQPYHNTARRLWVGRSIVLPLADLPNL